jgi:hypothetical protein
MPWREAIYYYCFKLSGYVRRYEACLFEAAGSGLAKHQSCSRMQVDVVEGDPLRFDAV